MNDVLPRRLVGAICLCGLLSLSHTPARAAPNPDAASPVAPSASAVDEPAPSLSATHDRWEVLGLRALALVIGGGVAWGLYRLACSTQPHDREG